jgi:Flp pilus assembly protein TadG
MTATEACSTHGNVNTLPRRWSHGWAAGGREDGDRGSIGLLLALLMVGLMAMAGLVVDGGAALAARGRAADVAQQAARAGADALLPASLRTSSPDRLQVDPAAARAAAEQVLDAGGVTGQVTIHGDTVTVHAHVTRRTAILSAVGINAVTGSATATATVLFGGTHEGR